MEAESSPKRQKTAEKTTDISELDVQVLTTILHKVSTDPNDRKNFSRVLKLWHRIEALDRKSVTLLDRAYVSQVLTRFPNLIEFKSSVNCLLTDYELTVLAQLCPNIEVIDLGHDFALHNISDLGFRSIGSLPNLSKVILGDNPHLKNPAVGKFVKNVPNLKHLSLTSCPSLKDESLKDIASYLHSITYLDLEDGRFTKIGLGHLANGTCATTLKTLILAGNDDIDDTGVQHLDRLQSLEELSLDGCFFTDTGGLAISRIVTLKKLNLNYVVGITDVTLVNLARNCPNIEVIDMSGCHSTGEGIRAFAGHMRLRIIALAADNMAASDLDQLANKCPSLETILLDAEDHVKMWPLVLTTTRKFIKRGELSEFPKDTISVGEI